MICPFCRQTDIGNVIRERQSAQPVKLYMRLMTVESVFSLIRIHRRCRCTGRYARSVVDSAGQTKDLCLLRDHFQQDGALKIYLNLRASESMPDKSVGAGERKLLDLPAMIDGICNLERLVIISI
jgi:hypothetical protein